MIIKQQVDYAKALTSSSSEHYEWTNVGNESIRAISDTPYVSQKKESTLNH